MPRLYEAIGCLDDPTIRFVAAGTGVLKGGEKRG